MTLHELADALYLIGMGIFFSYLVVVIYVALWEEDDDDDE